MARRGKQILSAVCALALLCALVLPAARADTPTIYLMAENDRMLTLPLDAMPAWVGGVLYVPYLAFDRTVTGVNLGVSYGQEHTESTYTFTLYSLRGTLVFDLNAGTCVDQLNGTSLDMRAVQRNGRVFLPLAGVCSFFGLNYTYTPTQYGTLIRITNGQEWLSTQDFVSTASGDAMRTRYYEYLRQLEGDSQETTEPQQTPTDTTGEEAEQEGLPVYLAVQCTGAGGLESILDSLGDRDARALFLFRGSALADSADQLRRLVGTGHAVGLSVSGASLETARAELEEGTALLEELAHLRPHTVYLEDAAAGVADALEAEDWVCWTANVDARDDGRSASTQATALLQNLEGRRSTARVLLDDSTACASMLERALPRMSRSDYQFRLALETRI